MSKPTQHAKELIERFMPHVYCYMGSGMLTNTYDEGWALREAKACASILCSEVLIALKFTNDSKWYVEQAKYWQELKRIIENA